MIRGFDICCCLVYTRLALDDTHTTVVVSCAKALQALLGCSANNAIFELHEVIFVPVPRSRLPTSSRRTDK